MSDDPLVRNVSDTAMWAAVFRGWENSRRDAVFRDPFAERLAGERGLRIAKEMKFGTRAYWAWIARTYVVDQMIREQIAQGADTIINLAAGLDARPYRMSLPSSLLWVEIDLNGIIEYKEEILAREKPACEVLRIRLDLSRRDARREVFQTLGRKSRHELLVAEGLLIYLSRDEVSSLAKDIATERSFKNWIVDITSPALLAMMKKGMGSQLEQAGATMKFAPEEGPEFFTSCGWKPVVVRSMLHTAAKIKRLPLMMRPFSWFPDKFPPQGKRPWSGVVLLERS